MVLLRRVIGDALRARRQGQQRTLREVSTAANVSLGYLSEIERGQKEASSELLAAICEALGAQLSELLGEVSTTLALVEQLETMGADQPRPDRIPADRAPADRAAARDGRSEHPAAPAHADAPTRSEAPTPARAEAKARLASPRGADRARTAGLASSLLGTGDGAVQASRASAPGRHVVATDGTVSVSVRREVPLKATLRATRNVHPTGRGRDVVCVG